MAQTIRIPLVGTFNQRGLNGTTTLTASKDQRFLNCIFDLVHNPITQKDTLYVEKRPGWVQDSLISASTSSTGLCRPQSLDVTISAFGDTNSTIYRNTTSVGTITGRALHFTETILSARTYIMIKASDGTGWYFADDSVDTLTYTGDTHTNTTIDNLGSTAGMYSGQKLSGTNIVSGTRIVSVNSATAITVDTATTGTTAGITITKEPIAKIISANFASSTTHHSAFVEMDGYVFYCTDTGNLYNSDLNTIATYTASNYVNPNMSPDGPYALARNKNTIVVLGSGSKEVFFNAGNATGSPLQRAPQYFDRVGTLDQRSITTLDNSIYFVSSPSKGDLSVFSITDLQLKRISTPHIDRLLGTYVSSGGSVYTSSYKLGGYSYVSLFLTTASETADFLLLELGDTILLENGSGLLLETNPSQTASFVRQLVYNVELELWSEWDSDIGTYIEATGSGTTNQILATSRTNVSGKLYRINPAADGVVYQDDGTGFTMEVRTSKVDMGTSKRKRIKSIRLICDKDSTGTAYLSWSDDDYGTWSTPRAFDLTSKEPKLPACGSHKGGRAYKLTHSSNSFFRAEALEIDYESESDKLLARTNA